MISAQYGMDVAFNINQSLRDILLQHLNKNHMTAIDLHGDYQRSSDDTKHGFSGVRASFQPGISK